MKYSLFNVLFRKNTKMHLKKHHFKGGVMDLCINKEMTILSRYFWNT